MLALVGAEPGSGEPPANGILVLTSEPGEFAEKFNRGRRGLGLDREPVEANLDASFQRQQLDESAVVSFGKLGEHGEALHLAG